MSGRGGNRKRFERLCWIEKLTEGIRHQREITKKTSDENRILGNAIGAKGAKKPTEQTQNWKNP